MEPGPIRMGSKTVRPERMEKRVSGNRTLGALVSEEPVEPTVREDRLESEGIIWVIREGARVGCLRGAEPIQD